MAKHKTIPIRRNDSGSPISPENTASNLVRFGGTPRASDTPCSLRDRRFFEKGMPPERLQGRHSHAGRNSTPEQQ